MISDEIQIGLPAPSVNPQLNGRHLHLALHHRAHRYDEWRDVPRGVRRGYPERCMSPIQADEQLLGCSEQLQNHYASCGIYSDESNERFPECGPSSAAAQPERLPSLTPPFSDECYGTDENLRPEPGTGFRCTQGFNPDLRALHNLDQVHFRSSRPPAAAGVGYKEAQHSEEDDDVDDHDQVDELNLRQDPEDDEEQFADDQTDFMNATDRIYENLSLNPLPPRSVRSLQLSSIPATPPPPTLPPSAPMDNCHANPEDEPSLYGEL